MDKITALSKFELNETGQIVIKKAQQKNYLQILYILLICIFALFAGYIKVGFGTYGILVMLMLIPFFSIFINQAYFKPRKIIQNTIITIENIADGIKFTTFNKCNYILSEKEYSRIAKENSYFNSVSKLLYLDMDVMILKDKDKKEYYILADYFEDKVGLMKII